MVPNYIKIGVKLVLFLTVSAIIASGCSNPGSESRDSGGDYLTTAQPKAADDSLRMFIEGFSEVKKFPVMLDKESYDSSKVISKKFVDKYKLTDDYITYYGLYFGIRFKVRDSIHGLVYNYRYLHMMNTESGSVANEYEGSDILFISTTGDIVKKLPGVYNNNIENKTSYVSNYTRSSQSTISQDGSIVIHSSQRTGTMMDGEWKDYREVERNYHYDWDDANNLVKGKEVVVGHNTEKVNPVSRKAVIDNLAEIKDLTFVPVTKKNGAYYRIKPGCMEGHDEFKFMTTKTSGTFKHISEIYCPILINEADEHSVNIVTAASFDQTAKKYHLSLILFNEGEDMPKLDKAEWELNIVRSGDGFWMIERDDPILLVDHEFATTLEFADSPCTEQ